MPASSAPHQTRLCNMAEREGEKPRERGIAPTCGQLPRPAFGSHAASPAADAGVGLGWGGRFFFFFLPELFLLFRSPSPSLLSPSPAHTLSLSLNPGSLSLQHCQFGHLRTCARAAPPRSSTFQRRQKKVCSDPSPPVGTLTAGTGAGTDRDEAGSRRRRRRAARPRPRSSRSAACAGGRGYSGGDPRSRRGRSRGVEEMTPFFCLFLAFFFFLYGILLVFWSLCNI